MSTLFVTLWTILWIVVALLIVAVMVLFKRTSIPSSRHQCGDHNGAGLLCNLSVDHYGDHCHHYPGTSRGDDKTWTWPRREPVPELLPPDGETASYLCAKTAHQIAQTIARDSDGMQKYKDVSTDFIQGMDYAEQLAEQVARQWENR